MGKLSRALGALGDGLGNMYQHQLYKNEQERLARRELAEERYRNTVLGMQQQRIDLEAERYESEDAWRRERAAVQDEQFESTLGIQQQTAESLAGLREQQTNVLEMQARILEANDGQEPMSPEKRYELYLDSQAEFRQQQERLDTMEQNLQENAALPEEEKAARLEEIQSMRRDIEARDAIMQQRLGLGDFTPDEGEGDPEAEAALDTVGRGVVEHTAPPFMGGQQRGGGQQGGGGAGDIQSGATRQESEQEVTEPRTFESKDLSLGEYKGAMQSMVNELEQAGVDFGPYRDGLVAQLSNLRNIRSNDMESILTRMQGIEEQLANNPMAQEILERYRDLKVVNTKTAGSGQGGGFLPRHGQR